MPAEVTNEIHVGLPEHPSLALVLSARWIDVVELVEIEDVVAFARYKAELGGGPDKNNGEEAVLAWTSNHGGIAIIDERVGARIAQRDGIAAHVCEAADRLGPGATASVDIDKKLAAPGWVVQRDDEGDEDEWSGLRPGSRRGASSIRVTVSCSLLRWTAAARGVRTRGRVGSPVCATTSGSRSG